MFNTEELGLIEQSLCRESMRLEEKLKTIDNSTLKRHYNTKIAMLLTLVQKIDKSLDDSARKVDDAAYSRLSDSEQSEMRADKLVKSGLI